MVFDPSIQLVTLGADALDYVKDCLREGLTLAHHILSRDLDHGYVRTFLPAEPVTQGTIADYRTGGKFPPSPESEWRTVPGGVMVPIVGADSALVDLIRTFLTQSSERLCVFEDALAKPSDPCMSASTSYMVFGDEVYHIVTAEYGDSSQIREKLVEAKSIPIFIGLMTSWGPDCPRTFTTGQSFSPTCLEQLAQRAETIIVGAYDGESYIVWEQRSKTTAS